MTVANDADFIMGMIPHHKEAVDTSAYLLTRTTDPQLQQFLQDVITVQSHEITQMKQWHTQWFGQEYRPDGRYMLMMSDLTKLTDRQLEKAYIEGMVVHHRGAIGMARQILNITEWPELQKMTQAIIDNTQTKEIQLLESWLDSKYTNVPIPANEASNKMHH
jgi:uncharacterized protein (DUF305 family)